MPKNKEDLIGNLLTIRSPKCVQYVLACHKNGATKTPS